MTVISQITICLDDYHLADDYDIADDWLLIAYSYLQVQWK